MSVRVKKYYLGLAVVLFFTSCVNFYDLPRLEFEPGAYESGRGDFIELNTGEIIDGVISSQDFKRLSEGIRANSIEIKGGDYRVKDIVAFQGHMKYFRRGENKDFNERIVKGKICVYRFQLESESKGAYYMYYLQKGERQPIVAYKDQVLKEMIADNPSAVLEYSKFSALSKKEKRDFGNKYRNTVIQTYNKSK